MSPSTLPTSSTIQYPNSMDLLLKQNVCSIAFYNRYIKTRQSMECLREFELQKIRKKRERELDQFARIPDDVFFSHDFPFDSSCSSSSSYYSNPKYQRFMAFDEEAVRRYLEGEPTLYYNPFNNTYYSHRSKIPHPTLSLSTNTLLFSNTSNTSSSSSSSTVSSSSSSSPIESSVHSSPLRRHHSHPKQIRSFQNNSIFIQQQKRKTYQLQTQSCRQQVIDKHRKDDVVP